MHAYRKSWLTLVALLLPQLMLVSQPAMAVAAVENSQAQRLERALAYRDRGELKAAVIEFKNALQEDPDNQEARLLLGMTYLPMSQGASAEKELRRALTLGAERSAVILPLAEALLIQGKTSELLREITTMDLFSATLNAEIAALRAEAFLSRGLLEQAATAVQQALRGYPQITRALLVEGRIALIQGDLTTAEQRVTEVIADQPDNGQAWSLAGDLNHKRGDLEKAESAYNRAIDNSNDSSLVQLKRALLRIERKNFSAAGADIQALRKLLGDHPDLNYAAGLLSFRQQDAPGAQSLFSRVLEQQPNNRSALFYLGAAHYLQENWAQAEHFLSRSLEAQPNDPRTATLLGMTRLQQGDYSGVETVLRPLLAEHADDPQVLKTLGNALLALEQTAEANRLLARAVTLNPDSAADRIDQALGMLHSGESAAGIVALKSASNLDPQGGKADILLIREYLRSGEFDTVVALADKLRSKWPASPAPFTLKGMAYIGKGQLAQARDAFEQALLIHPGDPSAAANLATLERQAGHADKARAYYQQVLKRDPGHLQTLMLLSRMESQLGNEQQAHARLDQAISANPDALQPRLVLAQVKLSQGRALSALATLKPAEEKHAANPVLLSLLGEIHLAAQQAPHAINTLQRWAQIQPASAQAQYLLAKAYAADNDPKGLHEALFKGLALQSDHPMAEQIMTLYVRSAADLQQSAQRIAELKKVLPEDPLVTGFEGVLAINQGATQQAVTVFKKLHRDFPQERRWTLYLAQAQRQAGALEDHHATLTNWLAGHPRDIAAQLMLATSYMELKRSAQATALFTQVVDQAPTNVIALNNLAWLLQDIDPPRALAYAEQAQTLRPDNPEIRDTLRLLRASIDQKR